MAQTRYMGTFITILVLTVLGYLMRVACKYKPKVKKHDDTTVDDYMMVDPDMDGEA